MATINLIAAGWLYRGSQQCKYLKRAKSSTVRQLTENGAVYGVYVYGL